MAFANQVQSIKGVKENTVSSILIVEDEKLIALSLEGLVKNLGYRIAGNLSSADEAIRWFETGKADLILMDIHLAGGVDGIDAASEINKKFGIPFIFISAFTDPDTIERAKMARPYGYLIKPFDKKYLSTSIELALYRHKAELKMREYEETRLAFMKAIPDLLFVRINVEGTILDLNIPENFPINIPREELVGMNISDVQTVMPSIDDSVLRNTLDRLQEAGPEAKPIIREFRFNTTSNPIIFESSVVWAGSEERIVIIRDITDRKKAESAILQAIVKTQDDERKRFAQDLHDSLGQMLTAVKFKLDSINETEGLPPAKGENLSSAKNLLGRAISEARSISHGLMPEVLSTFGLEAALEELCSDYQDKGKVAVNLDVLNFPPGTDPRIQVGLYRITQELLNNAIRHSGCTEVNIQLIRHKRRILLMVEDNGVGFVPENSFGKGFGLKSVSGRVSLLAGDVTFDSRPNAGTTISIEIPLNP